MSEKNRDARIDLLKFICAFLVLFLHTANLGKPYGNILEEGIAQALYYVVWSINPVEFFFVASAYFLFKKLNNLSNDEYARKIRLYIQRLIVLYLFWSLFYLGPILIPFFEVTDIKSLLFAFAKAFRRFFLIGSEGHMWYVLSLIYGLIILKPFLNIASNNRFKVIVSWAISIFLYVISLLGDSYFYILPAHCGFANCLDILRKVLGSMYLLRGPLFIMIGYELAYAKEEKTKKTGIPYFLFLWLGLAITNNLELYLIKSMGLGIQYSITILKPITVYAFWKFVLKLKVPSLKNSSLLAKASTIMYFSHIFFRNYMEKCFDDYFVVFASVSILCLLMTFVFIRLQKKINWLKRVF